MEKLTRDTTIDILMLIKSIRDSKLIILIITIMGLLGSVWYAYSTPDIFRAQVLVIESETQSNNNAALSALKQQLGSFGIGANGDNSVTQKEKTLSILKSRTFINKFVSDHNILAPLMASEWDPSLRKNIINAEYELRIADLWKNSSLGHEAEVHDAFLKILKIDTDINTELLAIAIEWRDAEEAKQWANWLVQDINTYMREIDTQKARLSIQYLQNKLRNTELQKIQNVFYILIEEQVKTEMLINSRIDYVFTIIDPAISPQHSININPIIIIILGIILSFVVGVFIVLLKCIIRVLLKQP